MENLTNLLFNPRDPTIMHLDLNSCFATIEQQANPKLRGKPIAVAAYTTPAGCILAPSIEAKKMGIKVGMRVKDGQMICPKLLVLSPDPNKYRSVHLKLKNLLSSYTDKVVPKSIDEFVLDLEGCPAYAKGMESIAQEIKKRIRGEIGDWLTVSVGIAPNRFLAKTGASLHKPDGLDVIDRHNFEDVYSKLGLMDLTGIKTQNTIRLNHFGIYTVADFYRSSIATLKGVFESILGYYWYLRLRGWEIDDVDFARKSFGNSYALPVPLTNPSDLSPIIRKLVEKTGIRMRRNGFAAGGVHLAVVYRDFSFWHKGVKLQDYIFDSRDIYEKIFKLLIQNPYRKPVREIAVSCFNLKQSQNTQMNLLEDMDKKANRVRAIDQINAKWGDFVITPARMMGMKEIVIDRVSFGSIKELIGIS
jgi:DNA polymerase IV